MPKWLHEFLLPGRGSVGLLSRVRSMYYRIEGACPMDLAKVVDTWLTYCIEPVTEGTGVCEASEDTEGKPIVKLSSAQRRRRFAIMLRAETPVLESLDQKVLDLHEVSQFFSPGQLDDLVPSVSDHPKGGLINPQRPSPIETGHMGARECNRARGASGKRSGKKSRAVKHPLLSPIKRSRKRVKVSLPDSSLPVSPVHVASATSTTTTAIPEAAGDGQGSPLSLEAKLEGLIRLRKKPKMDSNNFWKEMKAKFPDASPRSVAELLSSVYARTRFALWFDARLRKEGDRLTYETVIPMITAVADEIHRPQATPALVAAARLWIRFCQASPCVAGHEHGLDFVQLRPENVKLVVSEMISELRMEAKSSVPGVVEELSNAQRWEGLRILSLNPDIERHEFLTHMHAHGCTSRTRLIRFRSFYSQRAEVPINLHRFLLEKATTAPNTPRDDLIAQVKEVMGNRRFPGSTSMERTVDEWLTFCIRPMLMRGAAPCAPVPEDASRMRLSLAQRSKLYSDLMNKIIL